MIPLEILPEYYIQRIIRRSCSDAEKTWRDTTGVELRILSIGEWNVHEGPDFLHVSIAVGGNIFTGHAEVHKKSSDWFAHAHDQYAAYDSVVLHIVLKHDMHVPSIPHTLIFTEQDREDTPAALPIHDQILSLENLQDFAFNRLMRKSSAISELCDSRGIRSGLQVALAQFTNRAKEQRRRPRSLHYLGNAEREMETIHSLLRASILSESESVHAALSRSVEVLNESCGTATATELMTNVVVPTLFALLSDTARTELLLWYWQLRAQTSYGFLRRRFPYIPQEFVWQQQSMLEYFQTIRLRRERVQDLLIDYFAPQIKTNSEITYT